MKISILLPLYSQKPIGGFKVIYDYANELVKRGHDISIFHPGIIPDHPHYKTKKGLIKKIIKKILLLLLPKMKKIKVGWHPTDSRVNLVYIRSPKENLIPESDVIIATAWYTAKYIKDYKKEKGEKFYFIQGYEVWNNHKEMVDQTWAYPLKKIVISNWLMEVGNRLGENNLKLIPNAVDSKQFYLINDIKKREKIISMMFHDHEWKGSKDGLRALEIVKEKFPGIQVILFGVKKRNEIIPNWIQYIENPSAEVLKKDIYNKSSIYVCPSWSEGWGLTVSEAMACGCAVVTTKNGGVEHFSIDNKTALLSPIKSPKELAHNIIRLLENNELRISIANKAYEEIQNFNNKNSVDLLENYLLDCVKNKGGK